ncbi:SPOR domain-containing protein [Streptomyces macrosporus]|uniref:SPOR domain-containing protein n=1 Tax=Streptomyces macrosporus TaxID=44032 RepID=A0ABN3KM81_9ACTN
MSDSGIALPWMVIRQDANGNRYCVGRYATRAEAHGMAERLSGTGAGGASGAKGLNGGAEERRYIVERLRRVGGDQA